MKQFIFSMLACCAILTSLSAQEYVNIGLDDNEGDKIIFENADNAPLLNALGVESNAFYLKARNRFRWYQFSNANNGANDLMEVNPYGLLVNAIGIGINKNESNWSWNVYDQPQALLQINSALENETFRIYKEGNTTQYLSIFQSTDKAVIDPIGTDSLFLGNQSATDVFIKSKLAVGTTNDQYDLAIKGDAAAGGFEIQNVSSWPDFVFDKNYPLKSLYEIESFIKTNKHLPGVPSKNEVMENGVDMADMNALLLQKIEELTLYAISLKKQIKQIQ